MKSAGVILAAVVMSVLILISSGIYASQSEYLSLGVWDKEVISVSFYTFSGEPYRSLVRREGTVTDGAVLSDFSSAMRRQYVTERPEGEPLCYADILFSDGTVMQADIYEDTVGLSYGTVCLRVAMAGEMYSTSGNARNF